MPEIEREFKLEYIGRHILTRDQFYDFTERLREFMCDELTEDFGGIEVWDYEEEEEK